MALVSTLGDAVRVSAVSQGFRSALGIGPEHAGQPIIPLLPRDWRPSVDAAIKACMGGRFSKRVRSLPRADAAAPRFELEVYRAADAGLPGHMLISLQDPDYAEWLADPRVASLFPQLATNNAALVYETDVKAQRVRYRDNGLIERIGFPQGGVSAQAFRERVHPQDIAHLDEHEAARMVMSDSDVLSVTLRVKDPAGAWRLLTLRARVLRRDPFGTPRRMLGVAVDVTDNHALAGALDDARLALVKAEEDERRRIGRELHDSTAQHLLAIELGLNSVERGTSLTPVARAAFEDIRISIEEARKEIRMFSYLLHPPELLELGLEDALRRFCTGFGQRTGLNLAFAAEGPAEELSAEVQLVMYRVAQEALMNAYRHAEARHVSLRLYWQQRGVILEVEDDGAAGDRAATSRDDEGVGLHAMRARMTRIGGTLEFAIQRQGFVVIARAPLSAETNTVLAMANRIGLREAG